MENDNWEIYPSLDKTAEAIKYTAEGAWQKAASYCGKFSLYYHIPRKAYHYVAMRTVISIAIGFAVVMKRVVRCHEDYRLQ